MDRIEANEHVVKAIRQCIMIRFMHELGHFTFVNILKFQDIKGFIDGLIRNSNDWWKIF